MIDSRKSPRITGNPSPIARARLSAGMTQAQLAQAVGVLPQQIGSWERGERHPKLDALTRIAQACRCSVNELI